MYVSCFHEFIEYFYAFCSRKRLDSSTKVEDEASSLISSIFFMFLFVFSFQSSYVTKLYCLLFIKLLKHWIFDVFHPTDTSNLSIEIGYPLAFVVQTNTLDLLISIGYSLSFVIKMDSSNLSIGLLEMIEHA